MLMKLVFKWENFREFTYSCWNFLSELNNLLVYSLKSIPYLWFFFFLYLFLFWGWSLLSLGICCFCDLLRGISGVWIPCGWWEIVVFEIYPIKIFPYSRKWESLLIRKFNILCDFLCDPDIGGSLNMFNSLSHFNLI